ncbi:MAG: ABC transporter ATP-binding protein [Chloroflexota bacterium]|nr:ABC transporter ATP-binding protein [Chloroflexota bacterium]
MVAISIRGAVKRYGAVTAVAGVDLDVAAGECFGLLGPNGAGKTSLVRMVIAASPITAGSISIDGRDIAAAAREVKAHLGVVPQEDNLDPDLNVLQNLLTFARYFDIPGAEAGRRAGELLHLFELGDKERAKIDELSGGMKRRLLIARSLINQPRLLILDEPTVGLDPQARHLVWQRLTAMRDQGLTILLCTQNMEEAWHLCDRVAIMSEGLLIAQGTPRGLLAQHGGSEIVEARLRWPGQRDAVQERLDGLGVEWQEVEDTVYIFRDDDHGWDEALEGDLAVVSRRVPTLEDVYLKLTGRSLRE